eukprot:scaffold7377_cov257-Pinguiococcus_pyrenoidosus.AAC.13
MSKPVASMDIARRKVDSVEARVAPREDALRQRPAGHGEQTDIAIISLKGPKSRAWYSASARDELEQSRSLLLVVLALHHFPEPLDHFVIGPCIRGKTRRKAIVRPGHCRGIPICEDRRLPLDSYWPS